MENMILEPSITAEWQALVKAAKNQNHYSITDDIESYLVFLLMRFVNNPAVVHSILATDFLKTLNQLRRERLESLRDVGDKCLLLAGLFPGRAQRRRVRISYFVRLGQMAYSSLSETNNFKPAELYASLAKQFVVLMDILQSMREVNDNVAAIDLLQAEELWSDTRSQHALKLLRRATQGFLPQDNFPSYPSNNSSNKH